MFDVMNKNSKILISVVSLMSIINIFLGIWFLSSFSDRVCLAFMILMPFSYIGIICILEIVSNIAEWQENKKIKRQKQIEKRSQHQETCDNIISLCHKYNKPSPQYGENISDYLAKILNCMNHMDQKIVCTSFDPPACGEFTKIIASIFADDLEANEEIRSEKIILEQDIN